MAYTHANSWAYLDGIGEAITIGGPDSRATLHKIIVGDGIASALVTVYEGTTSIAANTIAVLDASADVAQGTSFDLECPNGFRVELTGGAAKVTVLYG